MILCIYQWQYSFISECDIVCIDLYGLSIITLPYGLECFLREPRCPLLRHSVIQPAGRPIPMYKRRWETIHRSALVIPHRWVHGYIRPQVFEDQSSDDGELIQLLFPGLRPDVVCWNVSCPVHPIPWAGFGYGLEEILHCAKGQVTFAICAPVSGSTLLPTDPSGVIPTAQWLLTIYKAALGVLRIPVDICEEQDPALWRAWFGRGGWFNWGFGDPWQGYIPGGINIKMATRRSNQQSASLRGPEEGLLQRTDEIFSEEISDLSAYIWISEVQSDTGISQNMCHTLLVWVTLVIKEAQNLIVATLYFHGQIRNFIQMILYRGIWG